MNAACIIAACAAGSVRRQQQNKEPKVYFTSNFDIFYVVKIRKYLHFRPITTVHIVPDDLFGNRLESIHIDGQTIATQHNLSIDGDKCHNNPHQFVKENIERYKHSSLWDVETEEMIVKYLSYVKNNYNIELDRSALDYTEQFCWEVEMECL